MQVYEMVFQGDISITRLPDDMKVVKDGEIEAWQGKLILQEGELTGHHHHIDVLDRPVNKDAFSEDGEEKSFENIRDTEDWALEFNDPSLTEIFGKKRPKTVSKLFKASKLGDQLVQAGILERGDLITSYLEIENGPAKVSHQEHRSITLLPGKYAIGRQIESVAGEERRVTD
jgi:hypothetical protein